MERKRLHAGMRVMVNLAGYEVGGTALGPHASEAGVVMEIALLSEAPEVTVDLDRPVGGAQIVVVSPSRLHVLPDLASDHASRDRV